MKKEAIQAARLAGEVLKNHFQSLSKNDVERKSKHEIVTVVDKEAEKVILKYLQEKFPEHNYISEESEPSFNESELTWIIDPLDGTLNYTMNNPVFCTSIGLAKGNEMVLGVVHNPLSGDYYVAEKGQGAYLNDKKIAVSGEINLKNSVVGYCHGREDADMLWSAEMYKMLKPKVMDIRRFGSAALELAYTASGKLESFYINHVNSWDVAAGVLLVQEAGGMVTDFSGKPWNIRSNDMLASNGLVHDENLKLIQTNNVK
ncbi:MAG: inositol monophosphatase family protein [bacterium]